MCFFLLGREMQRKKYPGSFGAGILIDLEEIVKRLDAVAELKNNAITREELREYLAPVYDLERLISRITYQTANPRDLIAFKSSLQMLPHIKCI